jgi:ABC transporter substrate binding protein
VPCFVRDCKQALAWEGVPHRATRAQAWRRWQPSHGLGGQLPGLVSYGADAYASGRQAARLVEKISKGTAPAATPVEVNSRIELVINLKVAAALGYTIAPQVLYRADRLVR